MHSILTDALADLGDEEARKQAGKEAYVLPGLATIGKAKRVLVMAPMKNSKDKSQAHQVLRYGIHEDEPQQTEQSE